MLLIPGGGVGLWAAGGALAVGNKACCCVAVLLEAGRHGRRKEMHGGVLETQLLEEVHVGLGGRRRGSCGVWGGGSTVYQVAV